MVRRLEGTPNTGTLTKTAVAEDARLVRLCGEQVREGREVTDIVPTYDANAGAESASAARDRP